MEAVMGMGLGITIGLLMGILLSQWVRPTSSPSAEVARFAISLPDGVRLEDGVSAPMALSPDGRLVVYVGVDDQGQRLYLRPIDELATEPMAGTEGAATPFFSPAGQWVGFFADNKLKQIAVAGGPAITIADAVGRALGASWGKNDVIAFTLNFEFGQLQVPATGGQPKLLTKPDPEKLMKSHRHPRFLPDGKSLLYKQLGGKSSGIWVLSLETGEKKYLTGNARSPHYRSSGYVTYVSRKGALLAAPYDRQRFEITGPAVALVENLTPDEGAL